MKRKDFLKISTAGAVGLTLGNNLASCRIAPAFNPWKGRRLVLIQLRGGHDGLFAVPFRGSDIINKQRKKLQDIAIKNSLQLQGNWYWNKMLTRVFGLWEDEELIVLPSVGYKNPNRSHFKAQEFWDTGDVFDCGLKDIRGTGWLGRYWELKKQITGTDPLLNADNPFLNLHGSPTIYDKGKSVKAFPLTDANGLKWYEDFYCIEEIQKDGEFNNYYIDLKKQLDLMNWVKDFDSFRGHTVGSLSQQLNRAAEIIQNDLPFVSIHTELDGFDTHGGELERLSDLYSDMDVALSDFRLKLKSSGHWKETLVFVYSDFGRTITENESGGTDHGHAGLSLLLGGDLSKFQQYRTIEEPKFEYENGEIFLQYQTDYRDLIKSVLSFL